jgi:hypothetical protein
MISIRRLSKWILMQHVESLSRTGGDAEGFFKYIYLGRWVRLLELYGVEKFRPDEPIR